jgi:phosphopentomutase
MEIRRAVIIVMDSCGVGEAPDAADYGDVGSDTIGHVSEAVRGVGCHYSIRALTTAFPTRRALPIDARIGYLPHSPRDSRS